MKYMRFVRFNFSYTFSTCSNKSLNHRLGNIINQRIKSGTYRKLNPPLGNHLDFSSNDYLGFGTSKEIALHIKQEYERIQGTYGYKLGSTGSRLVSGNNEYYEFLENYLAKFYQRESILLFNSGFVANVSLFACLPLQEDAVIYDKFIHNSVLQGISQSSCKNIYSFEHNNLQHLQRILDQVHPKLLPNRQIILAVESLYSMDGDYAPLVEICKMIENYPGTVLIVDEAHSGGIIGKKGQGLVHEIGLSDQVYACVHTFGKAFGTHGAIVSGSDILKKYLVNYARPLIYSTALTYESLVSIYCAHVAAESGDMIRQRLFDNVAYFRTSFLQRLQSENLGDGIYRLEYSDSPIQPLIIGRGNRYILGLADQLLKKYNIHAVAIRSPTVPRGMERLRIVIHANHTKGMIDQLVNGIFQAHYDLKKDEEQWIDDGNTENT